MLPWFKELNNNLRWCRRGITHLRVIIAYFHEHTSDRYADTGDATARHSSHAGQRLVIVLLRLLHIRHRRRAAVGGHTAPTLLPQGPAQHQVSRVSRREPLVRGLFVDYFFFIIIINVRLRFFTLLRLTLHRISFFLLCLSFDRCAVWSASSPIVAFPRDGETRGTQ